jgi:hypothetical protein
MNTNAFIRLGAALSLILVTLFPARMTASLAAYEGFDYTAGTSIGGQTGGVGWTNAWATSAAGMLATNVEGSLSYTVNGKSLVTSGGSLVVGSPAGNLGTTATPNRALNLNFSSGLGTTAGAGRTNWVSFLYRRLNLEPGTLPYLRQANFGMFEGSGERVSVGGPNTSATVSNVLSVWSNSGSNTVTTPLQASNYPVAAGATYLILIKVVANSTTAPDTAFVWFNWTNLTAEPSTNLATLADREVNLSSVNTMRFQAGNLSATGSNACFQVDELRVGTTFADVTPYQTAAAAPGIASPPQDSTVTVGDTAAFSVTATGDEPLSYRWYFNTNTLLAGQANATLTLTNAQFTNAGGYCVAVSNVAGAVTSTVATLAVVAPAPPAITAQPGSIAAILGESAAWSVTATGTAPLLYQWFFNTNTPLAGQTNSSLALTNVQPGQDGFYSVRITNAIGAVTSALAKLTVVAVGPSNLPAFPGADGAACHTTGGRGGIVYHVTMLDRNYSHSEPGTLRYGLNDANFTPGMPRTIVFDVAGVFWLGRYGAESNYDNGWNTQSRYSVPKNITLAGQTAPGPVIFMGGTTKTSGSNDIIRNVLFAPGYGMQGFHEPPASPVVGDFPDSYVYDAVDISGKDILLDHLTAIYATDEAISCNEMTDNLTIQNCNISQGQNYPQADAEATSIDYTGHALAHLLQAGSGARISVLNNLYAHQKGRLPRVGSEVGTGAYNDFRNCVFYNWLGTAGTGASGQPSFNNFIHNFYLAGPGGDNPAGGANSNLTTSAGGTGIFDGISASVTRAFVSGNLKDLNKDGDPNDAVSADSSYASIAATNTAFDISLGATLDAALAFTNVLRYAGSRWWDRGYDFLRNNTNAIGTNNAAIGVDERLVHETATGTGKIIAWADNPFDSTVTEGTEWRALLALRADTNTYAAPFNRPANWDTDGDGMPDAWEIERGLDPYTANNNGDFDRDGYTDLEEYLNEIAAWPAPGVIVFSNATNDRYAEIFNWTVSGITLNIAGSSVATSSKWQPSRFDTARISGSAAVVDCAGQQAGTLLLTNTASLTITNGWLNVASRCEISIDSTNTIGLSGALRVTNSLVNRGTLRLTRGAALSVGGGFTNSGLLDILSWSGTLPAQFINTGTVLSRDSFQISSWQAAGTNFQVIIPGYAGHTYRLQYCEDLSQANWLSAGNTAVGAGVSLTLTHQGGALAQRRFYRVMVD